MKARWVLGYLVLIAAATSSGVALADKAAPAAHKAAGAAKADAKAAKPGDAKAADAAADPNVPHHHDSGEEVDENEAPQAPDPLATIPHIVGPKQVELGHSAQIDLPANMVLLEQAAAQDVLRKSGNDVDGIIAAIVPQDGQGNWMVVIEAADVGYVSDDDASDLDADAMLTQFKEGTAEQNKKRVTMGVPALTLDGWSEPPRYEPLSRHLVWGLSAHDNTGKVVNFFTRILGRNGFLSVDLIDDATTIEASKKQALSLLTAIHFKAGTRYEDHSSGDKDSGLGLKALVLAGTGVVIAKKTGILLAILLFLKKGVIVVVVAIGAFFKRLFGRKKQEPDLAMGGAPMSAPNPPNPPNPPNLGNAPAGYVPPDPYAPPGHGTGGGGWDPNGGSGGTPPSDPT